MVIASTVRAACPAPQSPTTSRITHQAADVYWYSSNYESTYQVQWRAIGNASWNTTPVITSTSTSLTGLTNNTDYEWRVRAICAPGDTSAFTNQLSFHTQCDIPLSPATTSVTNQSARLSWNSNLSGVTYEVRWRALGSASWTVIGDLASTFVTVTGLANNTYFEWQVRTVCSESASSDYTSSVVFQTLCQPPSNLNTTVITSYGAALQWTSSGTYNRFDLQWRSVGTSTWILVEGLINPEYGLVGLTNNTSYEWQVRTVCSASEKSSFTSSRTFQTRCSTPTDLNASLVTHNSVTLGWSSILPVDLQWRIKGTANWNTASSVTSPFALTGLSNNTSYEWRVRTVCSPTITSEYTASQLVTTRCITPTGAYGYGDQNGGIALSWNSSVGNSFEVQWRAAGSSTWLSVTGISTTNYSLTGLTPDTNYEWRVRQLCSGTDASDFTTTQTAKPYCYSPDYLRTESLTNSTASLAWSSNGSTARYEVQWRLVGSPNWTTVSGLTTASYSLTGLTSGVMYEWRVRKQCSENAFSPFTNSIPFMLQCAQPSYTYSEIVSTTSARMSWSGSNIYPPYELQYRPANTPNWTSVSNITLTVYTLTGLTNNTSYEWRVRSSCPGGFTDFTNIQTFQTRCGQPITYTNVQNINYNSADLYWQSNSNNTRYEIQYRDTNSNEWVSITPEGREVDPYYGSTSGYMDKRFTLYRLIPGHTYAWRVRSVCEPGVYSDFVDGPMFSTVCAVPAQVSSYQPYNTSLSLSWYGSSQPTSYNLQWRAVGESNWNSQAGLTESTYRLTNLTPGATYEYRVRQVCASNVSSDFSAVASTLIGCKDIENILASQLTSTTARLSWSTYDVLSSSYDIQYRVLGTNDWLTIPVSKTSLSTNYNAGATTVMYSLTGLTAGVTYECRVRNVCLPGMMSGYSNIATVQLNCSTPSSTFAYSEIGATSANLTWMSSSASPRYRLQWRLVGSSSWTSVIVNTTSYLLTGLTSNSDYEWRVQAECNDGVWSAFSDLRTFQTSCGAISYTSESNIGANRAQINWYTYNAFSGIYTVQYRPVGTVIWSEISGLTNGMVSLSGLTTNTTYEYRVQAVCAPGVTASYSPTKTFRTGCSTNGISQMSIWARSTLLTWSPNVDNAPVDLQWKPQNASNWIEVNGITGGSYSLTGLTPNTFYDVRLQAVCSPTNRSGYPYTSSFSTAGIQYQLLTYADSITAQAAHLRRSTTSDDTPNLPYQFQWRVVGSSTWNTTGMLTAQSYLLTGLIANTTYEARVKLNEFDAGIKYGDVYTFTTYCRLPGDLTVSRIMAETAQLTWYSSGQPVVLQWREGGATNWNMVTGLSSGSYSLTGLTNYTTYQWRLQTACSMGSSSEYVYGTAFQTICRMPSFPYVEAVGSTAAQLYWTSPSADARFSVRYRPTGTNSWIVVNGITSTMYSLTGLTTDTSYEWEVATVCGIDGNLVYAPGIGFTTQCSLPTYFYTRSSASDRVQLTWFGMESAYELQWRAEGKSDWSSVANVTAPYTLTGLATGKTYEVRLRNNCAKSADEGFTAIYKFTVQCFYGYSNDEETGKISAHSARLYWHVTPLLAYELRWKASGTSPWTVVPLGVTQPYDLTGLTNNTNYEWQVRSECQPSYGTLRTFRTQCNAPRSMQTTALTETSAQLKWSDSGEGVNYELQWRRAGEDGWNTIQNIASNTYSLTGLTNSTAYEWQVRSQCEGGSGFNATISFSTADDCSQGLYTIRSGAWNDPTIWSCGTIPAFTKRVQIKHAVTIPTGYVANALSIQYAESASLIFQSQAKLQLQQ